MAICGASALVAQAPEGITTTEEYDAWKLQFVPADARMPTQPVERKSGPRDADGPCACWIEPDSSWTAMNTTDPFGWIGDGFGNGDDGSFGPVSLPFTFLFYGSGYDSAYININGNISFEQRYATYNPSGFPNPSFIMVAPYWADVDLRGAGDELNVVRYKVTPTALYVSWSNVGYFNQRVDKLNSFQLIISDGTDPAIPGGNNVSFCYGGMEWTTGNASGGVEGFGGVPATVGANRGDGLNYLQFGRFDQPGDAYDGPFGEADGVEWLIDRRFVFSTESEEIPPIFTNTECDTIEIDVGSSYDYPMLILTGGPGQTVLTTAESPTFSNFTTSSNAENGQYELVLSMHPESGDVGIHAITVTAEVDGSPTLVSTHTFYVKVLLSTGIQELDGDAFSLAPNPSNGLSTLHWPAGEAPQRVEVLTMDGKVVLAEVPHAGSDRMEIDLSGQPEGAYLVRTIGAAGTQTMKLIHTSLR